MGYDYDRRQAESGGSFVMGLLTTSSPIKQIVSRTRLPTSTDASQKRRANGQIVDAKPAVRCTTRRATSSTRAPSQRADLARSLGQEP
jgi:hypothetical protein